MDSTRLLIAAVLATAVVAGALAFYEKAVVRPTLERLWERLRSGEAPLPDPEWTLVRRLRGWFPYVAGIIDSPASTRDAQFAAVGVAVVLLFPLVVWIVLAVWVYQAL